MPNGILYELQVALYQKLKAVLEPLGIRVYDEPPSGAAFPYLTLGEETAAAYMSKTFDGLEVTTTFHLFNTAAGKGTIKRQSMLVLDALRDPVILRENLFADSLRLDMFQVFSEDPGQPGGPIVKHAVIRYRFKIRKE